MNDIFDDILGERGLRYKRNVLVICLVATLVWLAHINLGKVSTFGVNLEEYTGNKTQAAWTV